MKMDQKTNYKFLILGIALMLSSLTLLNSQVDTEIAIAAQNDLTITAAGDFSSAINLETVGPVSPQAQSSTWDYVESEDYFSFRDSTTTPGFRIEFLMTSSDGGKFVYTGNATQDNIPPTDFKLWGGYSSTAEEYEAATKGLDDSTTTLNVDSANTCLASESMSLYTFSDSFTDTTSGDFGLSMSATMQNYLTSNADCVVEGTLDIRRVKLTLPAAAHVGTYSSTMLIVILDGDGQEMMMGPPMGGPDEMSGTAATGMAISGLVEIVDINGLTQMVATDPSTGFYWFDVSEMIAPFMLKVTDDSNDRVLYSCSMEPNKVTNITPLTTVALRRAAKGLISLDDLYESHDFLGQCRFAEKYAVNTVRADYASLFENRGLNKKRYDFIHESFAVDGEGFDGVLDDLEERFYIDEAGDIDYYYDDDLDRDGFYDDDLDKDGFHDDDWDKNGFHDGDINGDGFEDGVDDKLRGLEQAGKVLRDMDMLEDTGVPDMAGTSTAPGFRGGGRGMDDIEEEDDDIIIGSGMEETMTDSGMEGTMTDSGMEGTMTDSGMEGTMTDSGMEGTMTDSGMEGTMTDPGMEGTMTDPGMEGTMTDSGMDETVPEFEEVLFEPDPIEEVSEPIIEDVDGDSGEDIVFVERIFFKTVAYFSFFQRSVSVAKSILWSDFVFVSVVGSD